MAGREQFFRPADILLFSAIVLAALLSFAVPEIAKTVPIVGPASLVALGALVLGWAIWLTRRLYATFSPWNRRRFAVLVFFLNDRNELLLVNRPMVWNGARARRLNPPGGRIDVGELPHDAVSRRLEAEAGILPHQYEFHPAFHDVRVVTKANSDHVYTVPGPYRVQWEDHVQTGGIRGHYAGIYVCRYKTSDENPAVPRDTYAPQFFSVSEIDGLDANRQIYRDIRFRYGEILARLAQPIDHAV